MENDLGVPQTATRVSLQIAIALLRSGKPIYLENEVTMVKPRFGSSRRFVKILSAIDGTEATIPEQRIHTYKRFYALFDQAEPYYMQINRKIRATYGK